MRAILSAFDHAATVNRRPVLRCLTPLFVVAGMLAVAGCGGTASGAGTSTTFAPAARRAVGKTPATVTIGTARVTRVRLGAGHALTDGGLTYVVRSLTPVARIPKVVASGFPAGPRPASRLWALRITVTNNGTVARTPFCGGRGIVADDTTGRSYFIDSQTALWVNTRFCELLTPGAQVSYVLPVYAPTAATLVAVDAWDTNVKGNFYGARSYVRFVVP
jgi:hypothetical protein